MITPKIIYKSKLWKMTEILWANFESNENLPKLKQASPEEVQKVWEEIKYSNHLKKVNDVLNILDFPDNIEEKFRNILDKLDDKTLVELVTHPKENIKTYILNINEDSTKHIEKTQIKEQDIESQKFDSKISKIKSVFTPEILSKNSDISDKLKVLDSLDNPLEKEKVLKDILELLKEPWKLKSIINDLWWADKNNPKYLEFKENLIWIDSSFERYFSDLENISSWASFDTNEIVDWIENDSWWIVDIDLKSNPPLSKMSLIWSSYSFDEEIDKESLWELMNDSENKLEEVKNSFGVLKDFWVSFDTLINEIKQNWWKEDFKEKLKNTISNFSRDIFSNLDDVYKNMWIESNIQIKETDITSFNDINSPNDLRMKLENIKEKTIKIKSQIWEVQAWIFKDYKTEIKELLKRKSEEKEKQLEILEFMKKCWFDLIPKEITDRIIKNLKSNILTIPGLNLSVKNINLENWNFWESSAFIDKNAWLNIESKTNLIKFVNKLITWNIGEPLPVESIANWISVVNQNFLKNEFLKADVNSNLGWSYGKIIENLKNKNN